MTRQSTAAAVTRLLGRPDHPPCWWCPQCGALECPLHATRPRQPSAPPPAPAQPRVIPPPPVLRRRAPFAWSPLRGALRALARRTP